MFISTNNLLSGIAIALFACGPGGVKAPIDAREPARKHAAKCSATNIDDCAQACRTGHADSCARLGVFYDEGFGVPRDANKAQSMWGRACELGNGAGCAEQAAKLTGTDRAALNDKAFELLSKGCTANHSVNCSALGDWHLRNSSQLATNPKREQQRLALRAYAKSCKLGAGIGCMHLGDAFDFGAAGLTKSDPTAAKLYAAACLAGSLRGCDRIGHINESSMPALMQAALYRHGCKLNSPKSCTKYAAIMGGPAGKDALHRACEFAGGDACQVLARTLLTQSASHVSIVSALRRGCRTSNAHSCYWLGIAQWLGQLGLNPQPTAAWKSLRKTCRLVGTTVEKHTGFVLPRLMYRGVNVARHGGFAAACTANVPGPCAKLCTWSDRAMKAAADGPLAIAVLLDTSASMAGRKLKEAKAAIVAIAKALPKTASLGVIGFDRKVRWLVPLQRHPAASAMQTMQVRTTLAPLKAAGGTNVQPALKASYEALKAHSGSPRHTIILMAGQSPYPGIRKLAQRIQGHSMTITAIGIGSGADRNLLNLIADNGDGRLYMTTDPSRITAIMMGELKQLTQSMLASETITRPQVQPKQLPTPNASAARKTALGIVTKVEQLLMQPAK